MSTRPQPQTGAHLTIRSSRDRFAARLTRYRVPQRRAATQSGLTQVLERMRILAICIIAITFVGCQNVKLHDSPHATSTVLVGTWKQVGTTARGKSIVTFLADGTYCTYEDQESERPFLIGSWSIDAGGTLGVNVTQSNDPSDITSPNVSMIQQTFVTSPSTVVMGPICPHCQDGVAGSEYRRVAAKATSCSAL